MSQQQPFKNIIVNRIVAMADYPKNNIGKYLFSLIRTKPECQVAVTLADFTPLFPSPSSTANTLPTFNDDKNPFTPSFSLANDQKIIEKNVYSLKKELENSLRQSVSDSPKEKSLSQPQEQLDLAPSSNYCQICREHFQNYSQHVAHKMHILRSQHNEFNQDIKKLCNVYAQQEQQNGHGSKNKMIKKSKIDHRQSNLKISQKTMLDIKKSKRKSSLSYINSSSISLLATQNVQQMNRNYLHQQN